MKANANFAWTWARVFGCDNITRDFAGYGNAKRYIDELSVTGLTSNPTIFDQAISKSGLVRCIDPGKSQPGEILRGLVLRSGARRSYSLPPIYSVRLTSEPRVSMAGCRWKFLRRWLMRPRRVCRWPRSARPRCSSQPFYQDTRHANKD